MGRRIYNVLFDNATIGTATQDIFSLKSGALAGIQVHHINLSAGAVTTAAEVRMRLKRGTATVTLASAGGSSATPAIVDQGDTGSLGTAVSVTTAFRNGTTPATTSGAFTDLAYFQWNVLLPFDYMPGPEDEDRETCYAGGAGFVLDTPAGWSPAVVTSGFFKFREVP